ncbi:MAG: Do family serine endopeptidase, partial [Rhodospirillales bacterium]|nr:Do family serine endopeptidase [Rhodospirillales bacterium]
MFEAIYDMRPTPPAAAARTGARRGPIAALAALGAFAVLFAPPAAEARSGPEGFSVLVAKVSPAVVNVSTTQKFETVAETMPPQFAFPPGSPFEEFSRRFFQTPGEGDSNGDHDGTPRRATALGSGFIIDPAGYVVTNNHVIGQAEKITVTLQGGDKFDAALIGRDAKTDLALLKIKSDKPLPFVSFGDSAQAQVGDWVIAVGNPFGLGGTVTAGIISARGRDIQSGPFDDFLQIDAPINRGNSGGPTFNTDGQVIGINSAIYSPNGGSVGIGFAIPASLAKPIVEQLRTHGSIDRGWLGVQIQPVTDEIANGLGLAKAQGALVSSIRDDGPAAKSGLEQGDVIVAVNGETVTQFKDLPRLIAAIKAGEKVRLAVWRGGAETTVNVVIGKMPQDEMAAAESDSPDGH